MLPLRDENPHPPGFKPKLTIALIIMNVIVFGIEVAITGQFIEFSNREAMNMFLTWGAVPGCVTCLLYTSPSPRDRSLSRMPSSA